MRAVWWVTAVACCSLQSIGSAQTAPAGQDAITPIAEATSAAPPAAEEENGWTFSLSAYTYIVPDDREYVQPTLRVDRGWLHLEARYNYEDLDTASVWLGYNWSIGEAVTLDLTPMIGGVFGDTNGVAPGC